MRPDAGGGRFRAWRGSGGLPRFMPSRYADMRPSLIRAERPVFKGVSGVSNADRRKARRARRDAHRAANSAKRLENATLENVADLNHLESAAFGAASGVAWKASTQSYMRNRLPRIVDARRRILAGEIITEPLRYFDVWERGKLRHIAAAKFRERVIQKAIARYALLPAYLPSFTTGNSANMKGRGTQYAIDRLKRQLARHYRRHGREGWILLMDYHDYFGSIPHDGIIRQLEEHVDDPRVIRLVRQLIDREPGDRGIGLGSEPNQVFAVSYPGRIDHWLEEMSGVEASGRYMDDIYCIDPSKRRLKAVLMQVEGMSRELGLTLNRRKTKIVKLSHGFTWLKKKWSISESGRIVIRPCRAGITRERRKLKALARMTIKGTISMRNFDTSYQSWRGGLDHIDAHRTQRHMDHLYQRLLSDIEDGKEDT